MNRFTIVSLGVLSLQSLTASAHADIIDVIVRGHVVSNDIQVGRYAGVTPGTPVRLTVKIDTEVVLSDEPQNMTTWYQVDYRTARFDVPGRVQARGTPAPAPTDNVVAFSGGDVYYQLDIPAIRLDIGDPNFIHCQFDGFDNNPFNNTGYIDQNLGTYSDDIFDRSRHFRLQVAHTVPMLHFRDMLLEPETFTFAVTCPADISGSSNPDDFEYGLFDGQVDSADFFYFLDQFAGGNLAVSDLSGSADPNDPAYGVPDGAIDAADFFYFLDIFVAPCQE